MVEPVLGSFEPIVIDGAPVAADAIPDDHCRSIRASCCGTGRDMTFGASTGTVSFKQDASERYDYVVDFSRGLDEGDAIASCQVYALPNDLRCHELQYSPDKVLVWLEDGSVKHTVYLVVRTIRGVQRLIRFVVAITDYLPIPPFQQYPDNQITVDGVAVMVDGEFMTIFEGF